MLSPAACYIKVQSSEKRGLISTFDIDWGIHKVKLKNALNEKRKKLCGFSFSINMANLFFYRVATFIIRITGVLISKKGLVIACSFQRCLDLVL